MEAVYELPVALRLMIVAAYCICASSALRRSHKARPGLHRFIIALPVVIGNFSIPLLFHSSNEIIKWCVCALMLMWLASFKALGWAINRGPLAESFLTFPQFVAVFTLPITPIIPKTNLGNGRSARQAESGNTATAGAIGFLLKLFTLTVVVMLCVQAELPRLLTEYLYAMGLYLFVASVMDMMGALSVAVLGLQIAPHFDAPYLSSSLTDYWSRRWNLTVGYVLRFLCYDPVIEGQLVKPKQKEKVDQSTTTTTSIVNGSDKTTKTTAQGPPSLALRATAVCWVFFISGVMHEIFIIYMKGRVSGYWLAFFSIQGPLVVLESVFRRALTLRGIVIPRLVAIVLTLCVMLTLGHTLFFPDVVRMGITQNVLDNIYYSIPLSVRSLR